MTNITLKCGCCFIIPLSVLRELAQAEKIETADRTTYQRGYAVTQKLRLVREGHRQASLAGRQSGLARLATALGTTVSRLLGEHQPDRVIRMRWADQPAITDATGWQRRILSPNLPDVEFEFIRTSVPAGVVIGEFAPHAEAYCTLQPVTGTEAAPRL